MAENYGVGIQSFAELMRTKCIYVDKTPLIYSLLQKEGIKNYFLSRPRRFGKSLLISTLKAIFQGKQELFQGFYIYDKIEWESYPIIHLSMSDMNFVDLGLTIDCYIVSFPNKEVKESFNEMLLGDYIHRHSSDAGISVYNIRHAFQENDLDKVKQIIQAMFHSLPVLRIINASASAMAANVSSRFICPGAVTFSPAFSRISTAFLLTLSGTST